jgi:hypothetical protein
MLAVNLNGASTPKVKRTHLLPPIGILLQINCQLNFIIFSAIIYTGIVLVI